MASRVVRIGSAAISQTNDNLAYFHGYLGRLVLTSGSPKIPDEFTM
jgi:hypothetical protein